MIKPITILTILHILMILTEQLNITKQLLDTQEQVTIDLQQYFSNPKSVFINTEKSSEGIQEVLNPNINNNSVVDIFNISMVVQENNKNVSLSDYQIYKTGSIYDQPVKIFLLEGNYIMMMIYMEHCRDQYGENRVLGLNITKQIPLLYRTKLNCTDMQTQATEDKIHLLVVCSYSKNKFFIQPISVVLDQAGFISNLDVIDSLILFTKRKGQCNRYSLKIMPKLRIGQRFYQPYIYAYCSEGTYSNHTIYIYNSTFDRNKTNGTLISINDQNLNQCLLNAVFIQKNSEGFFVITNTKLADYYNSFMSQGPKCVLSNYNFNNFNFAASRNFKGQSESYIFFDNKRIVLKSVYQHNYQVLPLSRSNYKYTSFFINQHYLGVILQSEIKKQILAVIKIDGVNSRVIEILQYDQKQAISYQDHTIFSTGNYLEKGFYYFQFQKSTNKMTLKSYIGYIMTFNTNSQRSIAPQQNRNNYTIVLEGHIDQKIENVSITAKIWKSNDSQIEIENYEKVRINSQYLKINLLNYTHGPVQQYHSGPETDHSHEIQYQYINYYNQLNISKYLTQNVNGHSEKLKSIAINNQLRISEPPLKFFYESFIKICALKAYIDCQQFQLMCDEDDRIQFKSNFVTQYHLIVLSNDKWIQYNQTYIEICIIGSDGGSCTNPLNSNMLVTQNINKIKLVNFQSTGYGYIYIEIFLITNDVIYYGYIQKLVQSDYFFTLKFKITQNQVKQLQYMNLVDINYDPKYQRFLLIHMEGSGDFRQNVAILFDRPEDSSGKKFIGHIIKKFDTGKILNFLTVKTLLITIEITDDEQGMIQQNLIGNNYYINKTRIYPLYGNVIKIFGRHFSDGNFIYIQVQSDGPDNKYLVYCPTISSPNILTHIIYTKTAEIEFLQNIGISSEGYPHSIGVIDDRLFAISTPNVVIKLKDKAKQVRQKTLNGKISLGIINMKSILKQVQIQYEFDNTSEAIAYKVEEEQHIITKPTKQSEKFYNYTINYTQVQGPVMSYNLSLNSQECLFLKQNKIMNDIFTKKRCLLNININKYGQLLDFISVERKDHNISMDFILTQYYFICVQNKIIKKQSNLFLSKTCEITNIDKNQLLIVCDQGQQSQIFSYQVGYSCQNSNLNQVYTPQELSYRYFNIKYSSPYVIFEIPIRSDYNNIYRIAKFNESTNKIQDQILEIEHGKVDTFFSKDYDVDYDYFYLLQNGLGVYEMESAFQDQMEDDDGSEILQPIIWISMEQLYTNLKTQQNIVYVQPLLMDQNQEQKQISSRKMKRTKILQIGTQNSAYRISLEIVYPSDEFSKFQYKIKILRKYYQQKDCRNTVTSKSKQWKGNIIKQCTLQQQQLDIFSNFIPITDTNQQKYIQFYRIQELQENQANYSEYYPFRMEPITSGNTFQINSFTSQMIVSSHLNFICYYDLHQSVFWTFELETQDNLDKAYENGNNKCQLQVILYNSHYEYSHTLVVVYQPYNNNGFPKAWIFRLIFLILTIIFCIQIYNERKQNKKLKHRINKFSTNIYSNQFEIKVKMNTKKSMDKLYLQEDMLPSQITFK